MSTNNISKNIGLTFLSGISTSKSNTKSQVSSIISFSGTIIIKTIINKITILINPFLEDVIIRFNENKIHFLKYIKNFIQSNAPPRIVEIFKNPSSILSFLSINMIFYFDIKSLQPKGGY